MRWWLCSTLFALGCAKTPSAAPPPVAPSRPGVSDLSSRLLPIRDSHGVPALAGAIVGLDGVESLGAVGYRRGMSGPAVTPDDPFHLGSNTKAMTASLLAMHVEQGTVAWDTPLSEVFDVAMHDDWSDVVLEDLALHQSGAVDNLPGDRPDLWTELWKRDGGDDRATRAWFAARLLADPPERPRGAFAYSNAGYILLGAALEAIEERSWKDQMIERLFEPLEMASCGFGPPPGDAPWGHTATDSEPMDPLQTGSDNPTGLGPAGTVHCNLTDWAAFVQWHLRGARGEADLPPSTFERMHRTVGSQAYGHGWAEPTPPPKWADGPLLFHGGSNTFWFAYVFMSPSEGRAWLAATNVGLEPPALATILELAP